MRARGTVTATIAAAVAVGALLAFVVARAGGPEPPPAVDAFLAAWRRSLTGTYATHQVVERRLVSGRTFSSEVTLAQRPPDRIRVDSSGTEGRVGGRRFGCVPDGGCRFGGDAPPYAKDVDDEMGLLRAIVASETPLYATAYSDAGAGCFLLVLRARVLAPPYGEDATFCFDAATGALRTSVVHRAEATDTTTTVDLRAGVRPSDLRLPPELRRAS
ncbi:MAG TPA: hypothetical protein VFK42_17735 [Acidimicrobiales bacterium]|jgi:hypothetical protein|nr:hypothetical protein [Acidimicrobiales bacterium]